MQTGGAVGPSRVVEHAAAQTTECPSSESSRRARAGTALRATRRPASPRPSTSIAVVRPVLPSGSRLVPPTLTTPGSAFMRVEELAVERDRARPACVSAIGRFICHVSMCAGSKPGLTDISDMKLRSSSPAPIVSVTASATSATTSAARARRRNAPPTVPRLFSCSAACGATRVAVIAGSSADEDAGEDRHAERHPQHPRVGRDFLHPRQVGRRERHERRRRPSAPAAGRPGRRRAASSSPSVSAC